MKLVLHTIALAAFFAWLPHATPTLLRPRTFWSHGGAFATALITLAKS